MNKVRLSKKLLYFAKSIMDNENTLFDDFDDTSKISEHSQILNIINKFRKNFSNGIQVYVKLQDTLEHPINYDKFFFDNIKGFNIIVHVSGKVFQETKIIDNIQRAVNYCKKSLKEIPELLDDEIKSQYDLSKLKIYLEFK